MKKFIFIFFFALLMAQAVAQVDTLGKWPFLFYYDLPEKGIKKQHSVYCSVKVLYSGSGCLSEEEDPYCSYPSNIQEYAAYFHVDDTIRIVGFAYSTYPSSILHNKIMLYDNEMVPLAVTNTLMVYENYGFEDSGYVRLFIPGDVLPHIMSQTLRLAFFDDGSAVNYVGDFYIGGLRYDPVWPEANPSRHLRPFHMFEGHDPPYHFSPRPFRYYLKDAKEWVDLVAQCSVPMIFPIIEPPCVGVDSVRVSVDSTGCLHAEWDSLRWQEQWVVRFMVDGITQPIFDTVDSCEWSYCSLDQDAVYSVSVQSRCTNLNSYTWSPYSQQAGLLGIRHPSQAKVPSLQLTPNPTRGEVHVECDEEILKLEIWDTYGRMVRQGMAGNIDVSCLPAGIYTVVVHTPIGPQSSRLCKK